MRRRIRKLDVEFARLFRRGASKAGEEGAPWRSGGLEWLLENDFVVAEALENLDGALPGSFLRNLPGLREPRAFAGRPRIEVIAAELVERGSGRVEVEEVSLFLDGYQEVRPLRLAELWALPSFLRLALLEDLLARSGSDDGTVEYGPYILSLRTLAGEDWRAVVEGSSLVHAVLREDPSGVYPAMDFRTRDRYRGTVERVAELVKQTEDAVARQALELARGKAAEPREGHVGYYLVDEGLTELVSALGRRAPLGMIPSRRRHLAGWAYFGTIGAFAAAFLLVLSLLIPFGEILAVFALLGLVPALGTAVGLANRLAGQIVGPRALPRLDVRSGIPTQFRTVVAVPVLLESTEVVQELAHTLETNYRANPDPALTFVLLSDFRDAATERTAEDGPLLAEAASQIRRLNATYGKADQSPFALLHRSRRWNPYEGRWMGWERKRGKLAEMNQLLLGKPSGLWVVAGDSARLEGAPFVITVDADTRMPRDSAARLVGTIAHPLNRPEVAPDGTIRKGYSVLQPRLEILPDAGGGTAFSRIFGGVEGLDLYAHAAFDVYQDLFDTGIYAGKGVYDVRAFEASLAGRTPENSLLSHDLFEGAHGKAGLVADLILLEDFPDHPLAYQRRAHRWIRGDWQLLPWLLRRVPGEGGRSRESRFSWLARWMIADNLRRSLQPPAILLLLLLGWMATPALAGLWTLALVAVVGLPFLTGSVDAALRWLQQLPHRADLGAELRGLRRALARWGMDVTFLPFEAWNHLDAVVRTVYRVYVSRRHLLEWTTAAATARAVGGANSLAPFVRSMWQGPVFAAGLSALLLATTGLLPSPALPLLTLWIASPLLARWASAPRRLKREQRGEFPRRSARSLARRIWGFYERFQGPERHWLAPDHYQESPGPTVAERTSPTNLGMAMVSTVCAWDLGFLGTPRFVSRVGNTVEGMRRLTRYRGHLLNWYDTTSLQPLHPLYVSTVDSGNLATAFLVTREALREADHRDLWTEEGIDGLFDTLSVVQQLLTAAPQSGAAQALRVEARALEVWMGRNLREAWDEGLPSFASALESLRDRKLSEFETHFLRVRETGSELTGDGPWSAIHAWLVHLRADVEQTLEELLVLLPWLAKRFRGSEAADRLQSGLLDRSPGRGVRPPSLAQLREYLTEGLDRSLSTRGEGGAAVPEALDDELQKAVQAVRLLEDDVARIMAELDSWYEEMDFAFLYDRDRQLFRIGFSVSAGELDPNHYDLLASEARAASLVAMSKGEAPPTHWLHLGRPFAWTDHGPVLLSWSGTMFEYLMPALFQRIAPGTVLDEACTRAVRVQRDYGRRHGVPWGVSESAYHVLSTEDHYQYRAFGVPGLGLNRSLGRRLVIAPYASLMATPFAPGAVYQNLQGLSALGALGPWGPYEALDFGPVTDRARKPRVVRSYMCHHHGMILAALANHLTGSRIVERFHRDPRIATVEPYLYERIPWRRSVERTWVDRSVPVRLAGAVAGVRDWSPPLHRTPAPVHHLTNGDLVVTMGVDGKGGSVWKGWSIVRGGITTGLSPGGPDLILMDRSSGETWNPLPGVGGDPTEDQQVVFAPHRAEFMRKTRGIRSRMDVLISPDPTAELRRFRLSNESAAPRHLRLALSAELALAPFDDDLRHPAFQKLFVRAEALPGGEGLLFERRRRRPDETPPVVLVSVLTDEQPLDLRWGTSRESFLGRGGSRARPAALDDPELLEQMEEPHHPLDPMASVVIDLDLAPWGDVSFTVLASVASDRSAAIRGASELRFPRRREWAEVQARSRVEGELVRLGATGADPVLWEEVLANVLHPSRSWRVSEEVASGLDLTQASLWRWGISGDHPFVLVEGEGSNGASLLPDLVPAQRWWKARGETVDIVVISRGAGEYQNAVRERVLGLLTTTGAEASIGLPGGVHIVRGEDVGDEERVRLRSLAAFRLDASAGSLANQIAASRVSGVPLPNSPAVPTKGKRNEPGSAAASPMRESLVAPSAHGGFEPSTGEYLIDLEPGETTPSPWVNVIARDEIGFVVTESGGSFTWAEDAGEFRLTPWHNDPVLGLRGEVLFLRDEDSMEVWTPAPGPLGRLRGHRIRHGWGRSSIEAQSPGLHEEVKWFLHPDLPAKIVRIRIANEGPAPRRLSVTFFADWVLGTHPAKTSGRLRVHFDRDLSAVLARNPYSLKFSARLAFLTADRVPDGVATDRREFLGALEPLDAVPEGLRRDAPGERDVPRDRACGVMKRDLILAPGEEGEVSFVLGTAEGLEGLKEVVARLRSGPPTRELSAVAQATWERYLGNVRVRTPDSELDVLMNGWLPYQTIASRLRGRTGFYQSSGAFGFRDQLQDVYTLLPLDPSLAEAHLLEGARRQFEAGDVLHWWHPGSTRGVRTRCSDDLLWLPWVLAQTVRWTGDSNLLDQRVPFLEERPIPDGRDELYDAFAVGETDGSLWEHALRAVERTASSLSPRGIPLMGTGDWNDGMDRVGSEGRGESIWLGWFFLDVCRLLIPIARRRGEDRAALKMEEWSATVREAIEVYGWDGEWYRRAYFDSGEPLGARDSAEARIDSIAQSWSVICEAADPVRARSAIEAAWRELVREEDGIVLLLTPPFVGEGPDPGYIASYPPGVRENGGQYTHAAAWLMRALARSGQGERVGSLLRTLLPTRHARGQEGTARYRVEPYVVAADVYGVEPHTGRGGWTWYTGSAGWLWRVVVEDVLGVRREGPRLRVDPCIPSDWESFEVEIVIAGLRVVLRVTNPEHVCTGVTSCMVDGVEVDPAAIPLPLDVPLAANAEAAGEMVIDIRLGEVRDA